jgi:hypothetical protein
MEFDKEFLRWFLLIGAAPIWLPVLVTVWRDFNRALQEEGGLFGRPPGPVQREKMRRDRESQPDPLISEPWVRSGERRMPRLGAGRRTPRASPRFRSGPGSGESRPRGFR